MIWRWLWRAFAAASVVALAALLIAGKPPLLEDVSFGVAITDRDGRLMRLALADDQRYRIYTPLDAIAPELIDATLLYEDRWFHEHPGVNPVAVVHALFDTLGGAPRRGASTITMQVARLRFGLVTTSVGGKLVQMMRAVQLEAFYTKRQILEAYLNLAPYGGNIEGIGAASLVYLGKPARELSRAEAMALAVMPQSPNRRAPTRDGTTPADMRAARQRLIERWRERVPEDRDDVLAAGADLAVRPRSELPFAAPHVCDGVLARRDATAGPSEGEIRTTIDRGLQNLLERRIVSWVERGRDRGLVNAAAMLVDRHSMDVLASVGSAAFTDDAILGQVDGTRSPRSPGSTLKPLIYALALEHGLIHPRSILEDAPTRYGIYEPENFDGDFAGPINATDALTRSRNVPAVELEVRLRRQEGRSMFDALGRLGIVAPEKRERYGLSYVLGSAEVTMRDLVAIYAGLANGGIVKPLRDRLDVAGTGAVRLTSPEAAELVMEMLRSQERPNASPFAPVRDRVEVAWKTGTSYGFRDAWTVAVAGQYVLAVWVGNFDGRGNPAFVGRGAAAPLAFEIIDALRPRIISDRPAKLANINPTEVCAVSGMVPGEHCPRVHRTAFIAHVSPIATCDVHAQVLIDTASGERACPGELEGPGRHFETYELWPSNIARVFSRAGLKRRVPPPYAARCKLDDKSATGKPPRITSPQSVLTYSLRVDDPSSSVVPFSAVTDGDARALRWFVDDGYVGHAEAGETFMWQAHPGSFVVRAVDDNGRADSQQLLVERVE